MKKSTKTRVVKAWAFVDKENENIMASLAWFKPTAEKSQDNIVIYPFDIYYRRKDALARKALAKYPKHFKVVPCKIEITLN